MAAGNFGDCRPLDGGVWELHINWRPGYRAYFALAGRRVVLLLVGGDKRRQRADSPAALTYSPHSSGQRLFTDAASRDHA